MQGSSSTTNTDINSKVEDVFTYTSSNSKKSRLQSMLSALLSDPILSDVPTKPTIADVDTLISLELGSAMKISVMKMDNTSFDVPMPNSATVKDLKQAIKKKIEEIEEGQMGHRHISWCILHPVLRHGYHKSTLGERNIASFMALMTSSTDSHGSFGDSERRKQRTSSQQSVPGLPPPQGSTADSTSSFVVGPSSIADHKKRRVHEHDLDHVEVVNMGRGKQLFDDSEHCVDEESGSRYERMTQLRTPSLDSECWSSSEEAFTSVIEKDRSVHVRCRGSRETLRTLYGPREGSRFSISQQRIWIMEDMLRAQEEELEQLRTQVEEMREQQSQIDELRTQVEEMRKQQSQIDELRTQMDEMHRQIEEMHRQMTQMSAFRTKFHTSQGAAQDDNDEAGTDEGGDDFDDDD